MLRLVRCRVLSALSIEVLGRSVQVGEHWSVEDARATMELVLLHCGSDDLECEYAGETLDSDGTSSTSVAGETGNGCDSLTSDVGVLRLTNVEGL